jgi:hypothetical protein
MKKFLLSFFIPTFLFFVSQAQLVSYSLQESYTVAELQAFLDNSGFALPIPPLYDVDVYQVIYKTPYKHIDSLITTSGIVAIPKNVSCASLLCTWGHGTFSKRSESASYQAAERPISFLFAGLGGVVTAMPDILGLGVGEGDSSILTHTYINTFHNGHTNINILRAARELSEIVSAPLNGEVLIAGYSQGGHTAMATNKLIQENYSNEFNIKVAFPMSGPYDLNKTMVDVMLSYDTFAVPGYLPYLLLGYHSVYESLQTLYPTPSHIFKSPYDTVLPPLFYSKEYSIGHINQFCAPVPRHMIIDSVIDAFENDLNHPLRVVLNENDLMNWAPENHVRIHYCTADEEVNFLNAVRADSAWRANGAPDIRIFNNGNLNHTGCVEPSLVSTAIYLLTIVPTCTGIDELFASNLKIYPNPTEDKFMIESEIEQGEVLIYNLNGQAIFSKKISAIKESIDLTSFPKGFYMVELRDNTGKSKFQKLVKN